MPSITDELWEEVSQEIPKASDPFMQSYLEKRAALIAEEQKQRADHSFRQNLSPIARRACAIAARVKDAERKKVWTPQLEEDLAREGDVALHPGMMFNLAKDTMETTDLWRIVRRMPKGALLHAHNDAMVDFDFLIGVVLDTPGMHIACLGPHFGSARNLAEEMPVFRFLKEKKGEGNEEDAKTATGERPLRATTAATSLWQESGAYVPGSYIPVAEAADSFPNGGRQGFIAWVKSRVTISRTDSVEQHHGQDHIWERFRRCFLVVGGMMAYEPIFRAVLRRVMFLLHADGVEWCELRNVYFLTYCREGEDVPEQDFTHMFSAIDEEVSKFKAENPGFWGIRMIWSSLRDATPRQLADDMLSCVETKVEYPHLVAGYDLVGQEDLGKPLKDIYPMLAWFRRLCAQEGVNIPLFLHAGETLGDGSEADENLFDAVLQGVRRIGHGFSLYKHPLLVELVKEKKILIESCPISNEVLRLCGSVLSHPLPALLARGVPCALSNDDPGMLGQDTAGATHDFWQALQGWDNLGLAGLGSLAENSVRWSAFEDEDNATWQKSIREASLGNGVKAQRLKEWAVSWEEFCLWVVTEFGDKYGDDESSPAKE